MKTLPSNTFLYLFVFFLCINKCLSGQKMSETIAFIQFKQRININVRETYPHYKILLITSKELLVSMTEFQTQFDKVIEIESLNEIKAKVPGEENIKYLTNDEYCLEVCELLNLRIDTYKQYYRNKLKMKDMLSKAKILVPRYIDLCDYKDQKLESIVPILADELRFPLVIKPKEEANNRGVSIVYDSNNLQEKLTEIYSHISAYQAEEYVVGDLYHCNIVNYKDENNIVQIGQYINDPIYLQSGIPIGSKTLSEADDRASTIQEFCLKVAKVLKLKRNSVTHLEFFIDSNSNCVFLEMAHRAPGGLASEMSYYHSGVQLEKLNFDFQISGDQADFKLNDVKQETAWLWFPRKYLELHQEKLELAKLQTLSNLYQFDYAITSNENPSDIQQGLILTNPCFTTRDSDLSLYLF